MSADVERARVHVAAWRRHGRVALGRLVLLALGATAGWLLVEIGLRALAPWLGLPLRALVTEEAYQGTLSTLRIARGTRILLEESDFAGRVDVVVVGDSMAFGILVAAGDVFAARLGREHGLRILNLAIPSAGPCAYGHMLRFSLARLPEAPTLLVYTVFANDILEPPCSAWRNDSLFVWANDARRRPSLRVRLARERFLQHSLCYQLFKRYVGFGNLGGGPSFAPIVFDDGKRAFLFAPPAFWKPQLDLAIPEVARGFERLVQQVAGAQRLARDAGSRLVVVLMPFREQVHLPELLERGALPQTSYDPSYDGSYDSLDTRLAALGVEHVDLRPPLRQAARRGEKLYWTVDGHLTPAGHAVVARALAAVVASRTAAAAGGE